MLCTLVLILYVFVYIWTFFSLQLFFTLFLLFFGANILRTNKVETASSLYEIVVHSLLHNIIPLYSQAICKCYLGIVLHRATEYRFLVLVRKTSPVIKFGDNIRNKIYL